MFYRDWWAFIDTCDKESMTQNIVDRHLYLLCFYILLFLYWWDLRLGGRHISFCKTDSRSFRRHTGTCNYALQTFLGEDGETNADTLVLWNFMLEYAFLSVNETKNPRHIDYTLLAKSNGRFFVFDFWKPFNRRNVFSFGDNITG